MIREWLAANPWVWPLVVPMLGAAVNYVLWLPDAEEWQKVERQHPRFAAFVRFMRAVFPHLRKAYPQLAAFVPEKKDGGK
jgi:hypothetical protein